MFRKHLFNLSHLAVVVMMVVAIYTHIDPDVPASILLFKQKPPYLAVIYILMTGLNLYLFRRKTT